mgnify:CR=1 FL=1
MKLLLENFKKFIKETESGGKWYHLQKLFIKQLDLLLVNESVQFIYFDFDSNLKNLNWNPSFESLFEHKGFVYLYDYQVENLIKNSTSKNITKIVNYEAKGSYLEDVLKAKKQTIDGNNILTFFKKPKGISVISFLQERIEKWKEIRAAEKEKLVGNTSELGENILYNSSNYDYKINDIIKPYWDEAALATRTANTSAFGSGDLVQFMEDSIEKYRPKNLPSRTKTAFAYGNIDDAISHFPEQNRNIYAVKAIGPIHKADSEIIDGFGRVATDIKDASHYNDDGENDETIKNLEEEFESLSKKYWTGEPNGRVAPKWEYLSSEGFRVLKRVK